MKTIIRAHQCIPKGVQRFGLEEFYTVFSSSSYSDLPNKAGVIFFENKNLHFHIYEPIKQLKRCRTMYKKFEATPLKIPICSRMQIVTSSSSPALKRRLSSFGNSFSRSIGGYGISRELSHSLTSSSPKPIRIPFKHFPNKTESPNATSKLWIEDEMLESNQIVN